MCVHTYTYTYVYVFALHPYADICIRMFSKLDSGLSII